MERSGPMSIVENTKDGGLRFLSHSPLTAVVKEPEDDSDE